MKHFKSLINYLKKIFIPILDTVEIKIPTSYPSNNKKPVMATVWRSGKNTGFEIDESNLDFSYLTNLAKKEKEFYLKKGSK